MFEKKDTVSGTIRHTIMNERVLDLLAMAFFEEGTHRRIKYELKDKSRFDQPDDRNLIDEFYRNYSFCYEVVLPVHSKINWRTVLQQDANRVFGEKFGIVAVKENRSLPCWVLVSKNKGRSIPRQHSAENPSVKKTAGSYSWKNTDFSTIANYFRSALEDIQNDIAFMNETGIHLDNDIRMDLTVPSGDLKNIEAIRSSIQPYGLDLIKANRPVEILVIKDVAK